MDTLTEARAKDRYIKSAKALRNTLMTDKEAKALKNLLFNYHKMGIKYFDPQSIDGYIGYEVNERVTPMVNSLTEEKLNREASERIVIPPEFGLKELKERFFDEMRVMNKERFKQELEENGLEDDCDEVDDDDCEISGDDVQRHDVIYNKDSGTVDEVSAETDRVFTWKLLNQFVRDNPDGNRIVIHGEGDMLTFFIPIPTLTAVEKVALQEAGINGNSNGNGSNGSNGNSNGNGSNMEGGYKNRKYSKSRKSTKRYVKSRKTIKKHRKHRV